MIQKFMFNIKLLFNKNKINFLDALSLDEFQELELYSLNVLHTSKYHSHYGEQCSSPNMHYIRSYSRSYITFHDNEVDASFCDVPVTYCESCKHYHAILPHLFIVPYCRYSVMFIMCVLYDKSYNNLKVDEIVDKYQISVSTLYRWIAKYSDCLNYYRQLRNKYHTDFFVCSLNHYEDLLNDLFDICAYSLFQSKLTLSHPPPSNGFTS